MVFGAHIRELRQAKQLTLRDLAAKIGVNHTYLSKIENHKLEAGHAASEKLIHRLAVELEADEDQLLLLAEKVPEPIRKRICERPDVFQIIAGMDNAEMDRLLKQIAKQD